MSEQNRYHCRCGLTIGLSGSSQQLSPRDEAKRLRLLFEVVTDCPSCASFLQGYIWGLERLASFSSTNHTNERDACPQCFEDEEGHFYRCAECEILHHEDWYTEGL